MHRFTLLVRAAAVGVVALGTVLAGSAANAAYQPERAAANPSYQGKGPWSEDSLAKTFEAKTVGTPGDEGAVLDKNGEPRPIVGGSYVTKRKPWIAALHNNGSFVCTAVQISPSWVLTASHCVEGGGRFTVRIGSLNRSSGGKVVNVSRVYMHSGYKWPTHDIALLKLANPYPNVFMTMARLSSEKTGQAARLYGWGSEHADWSGPLPLRLKYTNGKVSDSTCVSSTSWLLCTKTSGSVAGGDSGGPLFVLSPTGRWVLAGVCAVGHNPAGDGWAAYTSIGRHRAWIKAITGIA